MVNERIEYAKRYHELESRLDAPLQTGGGDGVSPGGVWGKGGPLHRRGRSLTLTPLQMEVRTAGRKAEVSLETRAKAGAKVRLVGTLARAKAFCQGVPKN